MLRLTLLVILAFTTRLSYAGDSAWLLCRGATDKGPKLNFVASLLEHRSASGDSRAAEVTLLHGDHVMRGSIADTNAMKPTLDLTGPGTHVGFHGTGLLPDDDHAIELTGTLDPSFGDDKKTKAVAIHVILKCEEIDE